MPAPAALVLAFVVSILASLAITPWVIRRACAWNLYDAPSGGRRVHTHPVPRVGGAAVFGAMLLGLAAAAVWVNGLGMGGVSGHARFYFGTLAGCAILFAAGLVDDIRELPPIAKLLAQLAAAVVVYLCGFQIEALTLGGQSDVAVGWLSFPLTIVWIVGVTNAFNLIDGLDGLATGIAVVALATAFAISGALGNAEVMLVCAALLGALLGFLRYNFNPARIFLGDSGSLFIGFTLAVLSVRSATKSATAVLTVVPLLALALPLLDTGLAMLRRWLRGVAISSADRRHIHHRFLALGFTQRRTVVVLYGISSAVAGLGVLITFSPPATVGLIAAVGGVLLLLTFLAGLRHLEYHEFTEVGTVFFQAPAKIRKVIRDRIHARDVSLVLGVAATLEEVNATLNDNAPHFGFLAMELCAEDSHGRGRPQVSGSRARAWKLDFPVTPHEIAADGAELMVLRIWCHEGEGFRPYGAERVARIIAPALERWLQLSEPSAAAPLTRGEADPPKSERAALAHRPSGVRGSPGLHA